ncbi:phospholipase D family protein [Cupriavidus gilardii]|nr:phospholipase D family protein [Cupriavidus gilardii]
MLMPFRRAFSQLRLFALPALATLLLAGCALPSLEHRTRSEALTPEQSRETALGRALAPALAERPGLSGIHPLSDPREAFAARVHGARMAERTLDVQYYIWRRDTTGTLLLRALNEAAERGVRVRLLLDDNGISGLDETLAALDAHPNIEVRLFNPFVVRSPKFLGYLTDFRRLNRRMHNKSFTVDGQATIVGGRNIGDEYFGATDGVLFSDLDVLAVGPIAADVERDFDRYWASASAYPVDRIVLPVSVDRLEQLAREAATAERDPAAMAYMKALQALPAYRRILDASLSFEWAATRIVSDDPAKVLGKAPRNKLIVHQLIDTIGAPTRELDLVSPYFVPTEAGTQAFGDLARKGVHVRVLTNAVEATDVKVVHSGYVKRRRALLEAGVQLFELRRGIAASEDKADTTPVAKPEERAGPFGSSGASLHAKTFAVDAKRVFVGSFNFDPRSANLNTELGFVIDSPTLAGRIESAFGTSVPQNAYEVRLSDSGSLYWLERRGNETIRHDTEPNTTWLERFAIWGVSLLPIDWLL